MESSFTPDPNHHYHFVTGKLASRAVQDIVQDLSSKHGFAYSIAVTPITVAALITPRWLKRHLNVPDEATHVIVPGYCVDAVGELADVCGIPVISGPNDCRALGEWFGGKVEKPDLEHYDIEIIGEINHAPRLGLEEVLSLAKRMSRDGANVIDFGCDPATRFNQIGDYITALIDNGHTVSVDTFDPWEAKIATERGASLVLSVNSSNLEESVDWGVEVVVIPDVPGDKKSFEKNIGFLDKAGVSMRLDPILEPIGAGFANSLVRYAETRERYPEHKVMMGIGNLTELTDVDSAGLNMMLLGICQELRVGSVLTTEVINWARSSIRECDLARRMVRYAVRNGVPPKRLSNDLVLLRDAKLLPYPPSMFTGLLDQLKDNNYRLFAQDDTIHLLSAGVHLRNRDPFALFDELLGQPESDNVDASHAFYLGYEMAKASIALDLGKQYSQDQSLDWGFLTVPEDRHRIARTSRHRRAKESDEDR